MNHYTDFQHRVGGENLKLVPIDATVQLLYVYLCTNDQLQGQNTVTIIGFCFTGLSIFPLLFAVPSNGKWSYDHPPPNYFTLN